jgi:hypothetical protein
MDRKRGIQKHTLLISLGKSNSHWVAGFLMFSLSWKDRFYISFMFWYGFKREEGG